MIPKGESMTDTQQTTIFDIEPDSNLSEYKSSVDTLLTELGKFDLTSNQCKVYVYLGKYGSKTAPEVCKALKIPRTETYHLLSVLQNKGIVSATFQHPIKFTALSLKKSINALVNAEKEKIKLLEKQENELSKIWNSIPEFSNQEEPISEENKFQMLQGINQIHGKLNDLIGNTENEIILLGSEKDFLRLYHSDFLQDIDKLKCEKKILTLCSDKSMYVFDELQRNNIKKMPKDMKKNICFIISDEKEMIFYIKNGEHSAHDTMAMWTNSRSMIDSTKLMFDCIQSKSKNIFL